MTALPCWNLKDLYAGLNDPAIKADIALLFESADAFAAQYQGKLASLTPAQFGGALKEYERIASIECVLGSYAQLKQSEDVSNEEAGRFLQEISEKEAEAGTKILFFRLEINALSDDKINEFLTDETVASYRPFIEEVRLYRPHDLDQSIEKILMEKDTVSSSAFIRAYDETLASMRVSLNGKKTPLTQALDALNDKDRSKRRKAGKAISKALDEKLPFITLVYNTLMKDKQLEDKWRKYESPEAFRHLSNRVEPDVVEALSGAVWENLPNTAHRYYKLKAKILGLKKLEHYDRNAPAFSGVKEHKYTWEQARDTVLTAYRGFSEDFYRTGKRFFDKNWIDAAVRDGKAQGAFAHPVSVTKHPYLLMSFLGKTRDVMTLAHELGHGIHQCLSAPQGELQANSALTFAETASVFGEMLTFQSILAQEKNPAVRRALLSQKIEDMINTVVRQTAFYRFEKAAHAERQNGELSRKRLCEIWQNVQGESLGKAFHFTKEYDPYWTYISHFFHTPFYVYAYAFGDCLVNALYTAYQESPDKADFVRKYTEMLKKGGTQTHKDMLSPFGLDARDKRFWLKGLKVLENFIDRLEQDV